jgi:hypothetical protein
MKKEKVIRASYTLEAARLVQKEFRGGDELGRKILAFAYE